MEDEKSDVIDHDKDAALVKIKEGTIEGAKLKFEDEQLRIQAEQEGRQLNAEENEAEHKDFATRLDNRGDGIYFRGEAKVVLGEEEEWMDGWMLTKSFANTLKVNLSRLVASWLIESLIRLRLSPTTIVPRLLWKLQTQISMHQSRNKLKYQLWKEL